jgi:hypothetical protein
MERQCICGYSDKYPVCDKTHLKINEKLKKDWNYQVRSYPKHPDLEEVIPGIYVISDFISKDQLEETMDFLRDNRNKTLQVDEKSHLGKSRRNNIIDIPKSNVGKRLSLLDIDFNPMFDNLYSVLPISNIMKYEVGDVFLPHQDSSIHCPIESDWGLVLYLNDDFEGGELYYPEKNITYVPQAGDLVIHGATKEFSHGTTPIIRGTKYVATSFAFLFPRKER